MSSGTKRSFNKSILDKSFSSGRVILFSVTLPARAKCHSCFNLGQSAIFPVSTECWIALLKKGSIGNNYNLPKQ